MQSKCFMQKMLFLCMMPILMGITACSNQVEEQIETVEYNLDDPIVRNLYEHQDHQRSDSLWIWFSHENPSYRYAAAMAFASIKDTAAVSRLGELLRDPVDAVRAAAAYAIGQTGVPAGETLLINAFESTDTLGAFQESNRAILEAIGKCGSIKTLQQLATVSTYRPSDTLLSLCTAQHHQP